MSTTYRYRSLFRSSEYRLEEDGVSVTERHFGRFARALVPYDHIPVHSTTITLASKPLLWTTIVSGGFFSIMIVGRLFEMDQEPEAAFFWGAVCLVALGFYVATRTTSEVFLFEGESLPVRWRRSKQDSLREFLDSLQGRKLEFLQKRLSRRVSETPNDEAARYLIYLRESGLVDENGYTRLKDFLTRLDPNESIGFK